MKLKSEEQQLHTIFLAEFSYEVLNEVKETVKTLLAKKLDDDELEEILLDLDTRIGEFELFFEQHHNDLEI